MKSFSGAWRRGSVWRRIPWRPVVKPVRVSFPVFWMARLQYFRFNQVVKGCTFGIDRILHRFTIARKWSNDSAEVIGL
jgi:hypothetical protein